MKVLWTDGSASPNPGPGGFAVLEDGKPVVLGSEKMSTNIRMEGLAMIAAIEYAAGEELEIHSDSEFWIKTVTEWAPKWAANGWKKKRGENKNLDIVRKLYGLVQENPVKFVWVRGHVGTEMNELADEWANRARTGERV